MLFVVVVDEMTETFKDRCLGWPPHHQPLRRLTRAGRTVSVSASTGAAALQSAARPRTARQAAAWTTAQSLLARRQSPAAVNRWRMTECLIVDEISMIGPKLFEARARRWAAGAQQGEAIRRPAGDRVGATFANCCPCLASSQRPRLVRKMLPFTMVHRQREPSCESLKSVREGRLTPQALATIRAAESDSLVNAQGVEAAKLVARMSTWTRSTPRAAAAAPLVLPPGRLWADVAAQAELQAAREDAGHAARQQARERPLQWLTYCGVVVELRPRQVASPKAAAAKAAKAAKVVALVAAAAASAPLLLLVEKCCTAASSTRAAPGTARAAAAAARAAAAAARGAAAAASAAAARAALACACSSFCKADQNVWLELRSELARMWRGRGRPRANAKKGKSCGRVCTGGDRVAAPRRCST
jgi:hypothetical protein